MKFILGLILGVLIIPTTIYLYFRFGYAPVATAASPIPFERKLAHLGLDARIDKEAPKQAAFQATEPDLQDGAQLYLKHCAECHGGWGTPKTPTAAGMYPNPPQLLDHKGVTDDPPGETYWKVTNGIRLTGMPAYDNTLSEKQRWEISLLLAGADKLPASVLTTLKQPPPGQ